MDCSPQGSSVQGISQARKLKWVAISFPRRSSQPRDQTQVSFIGKQILYHWATKEAPNPPYFKKTNKQGYVKKQWVHLKEAKK